ncbi:MAG: phosphoribosyltransferase family protein [Balneolales bacterium]
MKYKSFADLSDDIYANIQKIPASVDLIVGIPRSGLMAGNLIANTLNLPIIDLDGFINNREIKYGETHKTIINYPKEANHVLIVDDTIDSGRSLNNAKDDIHTSSITQLMTYCTVYAHPRTLGKIDIHMKELSTPRAFEWNIMHNSKLSSFCVNIDGVLCMNPTAEEKATSNAYIDYLKNAKPLLLPTLKVGYLVTNRIEKYRKETESWLGEHNIQYGELHMMNASVTENNDYAHYKAHIFKMYPKSSLFIESNSKQARLIANLTGKPVLCTCNQKLYIPKLSLAKLLVTFREYYYRTNRMFNKIVVRIKAQSKKLFK